MHGHEQLMWSRTIAGEVWVPGDGGGEPRCTPCIGVKALMLAILEDAIRSYHGPIQREREEAALWMADRRNHWVFSFPAVCETLGLEPTAVRKAMSRIRTRSAAAPGIARSRPNSRRQAGLRVG